MKKHQSELLPAEPPDFSTRRQLVVDFWVQINMSGDAGASSWEILDRLSNRVTECLAYETPDVQRAEAITARAMMLMSGQTDF